MYGIWSFSAEHERRVIQPDRPIPSMLVRHPCLLRNLDLTLIYPLFCSGRRSTGTRRKKLNNTRHFFCSFTTRHSSRLKCIRFALLYPCAFAIRRPLVHESQSLVSDILVHPYPEARRDFCSVHCDTTAMKGDSDRFLRTLESRGGRPTTCDSSSQVTPGRRGRRCRTRAMPRLLNFGCWMKEPLKTVSIQRQTNSGSLLCWLCFIYASNHSYVIALTALVDI